MDEKIYVKCIVCGHTRDDFWVTEEEYVETGAEPIFHCPVCGIGRVCVPVDAAEF